MGVMGRIMNWYKAADTSTSVTLEQFIAMDLVEKEVLAYNPNITQETQRLFFNTEINWGENWALRHLTLENLAENRGITPETQRLFFTQEYKGKANVLNYLSRNKSIITDVQIMFFTQEYEFKNTISRGVIRNTSFLKECTLEQLRTIARFLKGAERLYIHKKRLDIYKKRLEQIRGIR